MALMRKPDEPNLSDYRADHRARCALCALVLVFSVALLFATEDLADEAGKDVFPRGLIAIGFQRASWTAWGPSITIDAAMPGLAKLVSLEAVFGFVPNWDAWSYRYYDAYVIRTYLRPIRIGRSNVYAVGMFGSAAFIEDLGGSFVEGRCFIFGAYAGGEIDLRDLGLRVPVSINLEGGYEYKLNYAESLSYITFGLGARVWL